MSAQENKILIRVLIGILCAAAIFFVLRIFLCTPECQVRKFILSGKKVVEARNTLTGASMISANYYDKYGNDRDSMIYCIRKAFTYYKSIRIQILKMDIKLDESKSKAEVEVEALVTCRGEQGIEKIFKEDKGRVRLVIIKENKKWLLAEVEFLDAATIMGATIF